MVDVWNEVHWMIHIQFVDCFCQVVEYSEISKETAELREGGRWAHFQNMEKLGKFGKLREWEAGLEKLGLVIWITFIVTTSDKTFPYFDSLGSHILYKYLQAGIQSRKYLQPLLYKRFLKGKNHSEDKNAKHFMCYFFFHWQRGNIFQRVCEEHEKQLPHHIAKKKIPFTDLATGNAVK